jgi:mRNA (2'-O-methyladenosine-N6-)-methyltransferase
LDDVGSAKHAKKRKRQIDEDADSAEEEEAEASILITSRKMTPATTLASLSREVQEIYALLQRGTARKKLLAEQVRSLVHRISP